MGLNSQAQTQGFFPRWKTLYKYTPSAYLGFPTESQYFPPEIGMRIEVVGMGVDDAGILIDSQHEGLERQLS